MCKELILSNLIVTYKFINIFKKISKLVNIDISTEQKVFLKMEVYSMLNESVIKVIKNQMWDLATCANGEPNVVPVAFKDVTDDGKLVVGDVFLETTLNNIRENNGKIAISAYDAQSLEGYQIKGTAEYVTEGALVDNFKEMVEKMFNGAATAKGALIIKPEKVIVTTPGADNKKELQS